MPTTADLEERALWKLDQAGYAVTIHPGHGSIIINPSGGLVTIGSCCTTFYDKILLHPIRLATA